LARSIAGRFSVSRMILIVEALLRVKPAQAGQLERHGDALAAGRY
jgi:hypothetical protein